MIELCFYLSIEDSVDGVKDVGCHNDLTIDSEDGVLKSFSNETDDTLHTGDFLIEEDIERDSHTFFIVRFRIWST